jgi:hypothetical protein
MHAGLVLTLGLFASLAVTAGVAGERLGYAGFTLDISIAEASAKFPRSTVRDSLIQVGDSDSRDHIGYISIGKESVGIGFARRSNTGVEQFPRCMDVFNRLYATYRGPDIVQHMYEAETKVHRRVWKRGTERLALRCFDKDGERYAERVELYRYSDSAI